MKNLLFFLLVLPACFVGNTQGSLNKIITENNYSSDTSGISKEYISRNDAEKILGEPVKLASQKEENTRGIIKNKMTYTALQSEPTSNESVNLFCSLDRYADSVGASNAYLDILKNNDNMPGQTPLTGIGDNAWYHSDNKNFCIIIARKKEYLLLIKVNKLTGKFSPDELKNISRKIVVNL